MIAINLRGTSGSGKSTIVRRIMELCPNRIANFMDGRKRPISYLVGWPGGTPVYVPGHYETACGGCDTIKTVDQVYAMVRMALRDGCNVLYEGIMVADDVSRAVFLSRVEGVSLYVVRLNTPIEDSLASIRDRRAERGDVRPMSEKNTRTRHDRHVRHMARLRDAGVATEALGRDEAFARVCELLGV